MLAVLAASNLGVEGRGQSFSQMASLSKAPSASAHLLEDTHVHNRPLKSQTRRKWTLQKTTRAFTRGCRDKNTCKISVEKVPSKQLCVVWIIHNMLTNFIQTGNPLKKKKKK